MGAADPPGRRPQRPEPVATEEISRPGLVARVLPDTSGPDKAFDYVVPPELVASVCVGTRVRVVLARRRVGGWVMSLGEPSTDRALAPLAAVSGLGPTRDVIELAAWAAWRWAGRTAAFLATASPPRVVRATPEPSRHRQAATVPDTAVARAATEVLAGGGGVLRVPPAADGIDAVLAAVVHAQSGRGDILVVVPGAVEAGMTVRRLAARGLAVAEMPDGWARAAAGGAWAERNVPTPGLVVVGTRSAVWAPWPRPGALVVLGESDEALRSERVPTWHARDVALERARRLGVPCLLVDATPTLEALAPGGAIRPGRPARLDRATERQGWAPLEVIDRRDEEPGLGLFSRRLVALVRDAGPDHRVVCVLNRKGRARLVVCLACGEPARCQACGTGMGQGPVGAGLECQACSARREAMCQQCGATRLKGLRPGIIRAREELELLCGRVVTEMSAESPGGEHAGDLVLGTEAALHRLAGAAVVAFLEFDSELLAPRMRAGEQALRLLARASRLVGGRHGGGRVVVQTRVGDHECIEAARHGDPDRFTTVEMARRIALSLPPVTALARVSGPGAEELLAGVMAPLPGPAPALEVSRVAPSGRGGEHWLVRAGDHQELCDALARASRERGRGRVRVRVEVDPERV